ncbi:MAG: hypothetical protein LC635_01030, partial [Pseudonocardiaceae bacterium]|nr:hypothetical protein [Pseudonocardiaceae bacterium]
MISDYVVVDEVDTPSAEAGAEASAWASASTEETDEWYYEADLAPVWQGHDLDDETADVTYYATDDSDVAVVPVLVKEPVYIIETDDDIAEWSNDGWVGAAYEDTTAHAGAGGAWVSSTEAGAISVDNGFLNSNDTAAWYRDVTVGAGPGGAFVDLTESGAASGDDFGWNDYGHGYGHGYDYG